MSSENHTAESLFFGWLHMQVGIIISFPSLSLSLPYDLKLPCKSKDRKSLLQSVREWKKYFPSASTTAKRLRIGKSSPKVV